MSEARAASRYAKAVMDLALETKKLKEVEKDMRAVQETIEGSERLRDVLASPVVKASDKEAALQTIFKGADPLSKELFGLLSRNKRIGLLGDVAAQFLLQYEQMQGQDVAKVTTAVPMTPALEKKILKQLREITGKEVSLENEVDPSLIGGFILRVGDLEYNASIASKLGNLKRELVQ